MTAKQQSGEWWAQVSHQLQAHVREETAFLERYEELVERADDPAIAFLLHLILDDERRHHVLFEQMASAALGRGDGPPTVPNPSPELADALRDATDRFLAAEREDGDRLRRLRKELKPLRDDTLWPLLVEMMEIDTQKHVRILEYLSAQLRREGKR